MKNAAQWQIPDAEGYAKALIEKNVLMRSNPLNMKLTRSIRQMAKRHLSPFGFGLGASWQERLIQQSILKTVFVVWVKS